MVATSDNSNGKGRNGKRPESTRQHTRPLDKKAEAPRPKPHTRKARQGAMIAALAETGNVCSAAEAVGIHRRRHYDWCAADPEYRHAAAVALDKAADVLEREAIRRAHEGVRRYKFTSSGQPVMWTNPATSEPEHYYEDSRSDLLLIFMLKAARPEKFRERHDVSGDAIRPIVVTYGPNMQGAIDRI